ncbi:MAG: hypothetical protein KGH61_00710 [Candidatus Micrarchaeota archaeon]|nr:hypothetical protein [Candidatus Micrarchaeota archaeon]MDE1847457.1 hypothetical protein [Candidatus Micrarchaeota archaeon]MDE1864048.1 hypothetical protein [Candidatus Micrarchaeota archaeon]
MLPNTKQVLEAKRVILKAVYNAKKSGDIITSDKLFAAARGENVERRYVAALDSLVIESMVEKPFSAISVLKLTQTGEKKAESIKEDTQDFNTVALELKTLLKASLEY